MTVPFKSILLRESLPNNFLRFSEVEFSHFSTYLKLFSFRNKRKPKIFVFRKCDGKSNEKKFSLLQNSKFNISKIFGKIILKPSLVISKRFNLPQDDRTDTNFFELLRMHFQRYKSTLDSLKIECFQCISRRKSSLGAPE